MVDIALKGSCLCGGIRYEASGKALNFFHCHCERCRKATGTGHASNIIAADAEVRFTEGSDLLREYRVPDAKFFTNAFCSVCGSRLPRVSTARQVAVIPAGSLDVDPGIVPDARIFKSSAAGWSCTDGSIAEHEKYPPRP